MTTYSEYGDEAGSTFLDNLVENFVEFRFAIRGLGIKWPLFGFVASEIGRVAVLGEKLSASAPLRKCNLRPAVPLRYRKTRQTALVCLVLGSCIGCPVATVICPVQVPVATYPTDLDAIQVNCIYHFASTSSTWLEGE